ncbi:MAG: hypothetical protein ACK4N5_16085, partial [Myxococcales bacterium]
TRAQVPTRAEFEKVLKEREAQLAAKLTPDAIDRLYPVLTDIAAVMVRFRRFSVPFGLALLALYTSVIVVAMRALQFAPFSPQRLSFLSLLVLPARVAVAAVDLAENRALAPLLRTALSEVVTVMEREGAGAAATEELQRTMSAVVDLVTFGMIGWDAVTALAVCVLFTVSWRYFQRPEVVEWYELRVPAEERVDDD